ncbi:cysteine desulfurase-like protein [Nocardioides salsibiostraticola]
MRYDVHRVRDAFPALRDGPARFDNPGGSQVPRVVADAVATAMTAGMCQRGSTTASQRLTEATTLEARAAMGDLLGADPRGIVFGRSMTQLTMDFARTLAHGWGPGDEVVVSRLDHDANIRPWVIAAEGAGATVRWLEFDPVTAEPASIDSVVTERTRLVALTAASNLFGTRPDLDPVTQAAHRVGALVYLDAVHLAPHASIDLAVSGVDFLVCSPYKFFGPHLGVLAAHPDLLETLRPDKLLPSSDAVPERFELGTLPYELLAGVTACVDFIAGLDGGVTGDRRAAILASMATVESYESHLCDRFTSRLGELEGFDIAGSPARRTPTFPVVSHHHSAAHLSERLADCGILAPSGHFYAYEAARHAGLDQGALRIGFAAYTTVEDVDRLVDALATIDAIDGH